MREEVMRKRRKQLLSLLLAVGLVVSNLAPQTTIMATSMDKVTTESESREIPQDGIDVLTDSEEENLTEDNQKDVEGSQDLKEDEQEKDDKTSPQTDTDEKETKDPKKDTKETNQDVNTTEEDETQDQQKSTRAIVANGLFAEYYTTSGNGTNVKLDKLKSKGVDYNINFADLERKLEATTGQNDYAGIRWTGQIQVPETGAYTFYAFADNGIRVWIDGEQLINYWDATKWDDLQTSKKVNLEAGQFYDIKVEFFEYDGGSHAILSWSNETTIPEKSVIPPSAFYLPADYEGIYIKSLDTSAANLKEGAEFNGAITLDGQALDSVESFEIVQTSGQSLETPVQAEVIAVQENMAELMIPSLTRGVYKIKARAGETEVVSKSLIVIQPSTAGGEIRNERPRADWERSSYENLNGWWEFDFDQYEEGKESGWYDVDKEFSNSINVPFCWEAPLSGVNDPDYKGQAWYKRVVHVDESWEGQKIFLTFGAVDWKSKLWVNGEEVGEHIGGYSAFEMDVTEFMNAGEDNIVTLWVEDYGNYGDDSYPALIGKQGRNAPCGYTHTSGIWQTVGMEARSATYLDSARAASDIDNATVTYSMDITSDEAQELTVEYDFQSTLYDVENDTDIATGSTVVGSQQITVDKGVNTLDLAPIAIENQKLWSHTAPNLYQGSLTVKDSQGHVLDELSTYFGLRKVETKYYNEALGVKYIYLNNEPVYMSGLLDQGYWEDGNYTAPNEEALKYDILAMKEAGFNMIRKHLKIEDPLQYYWCDKLGMMFWQDMPHATAMVPTQTGGVALGRKYYEECLEKMMDMTYNHPSVVGVMLFNETWGLGAAYGNDGANRHVKASDGKSTAQWVEYLYNRTKELNPNMVVEDMSACNNDHVQPTDLNTYHIYPKSYSQGVTDVENYVNGAYVGSTNNFKFGYKQDGDPLLNSEYGGVAAYDGDFDVSYCFKYLTDIQRRYEKQSGFVYTEPYDVEYERNGILTYDRQWKIFGYDGIAYGGDMSIKDLTQEIYIGIDDQPIRNVKPGQKIKTKIMAISWTNDIPEDTTAKWRFDGTDIYGNNITTNSNGTLDMAIVPYEKATASISFQVPAEACVGTLTAWIEDSNGVKIAKNFSNIVVADDTSKNQADTMKDESGAVTMKAAVSDARMVTTQGNGTQDYSYVLPEDFDLNSLDGMRVIAEASSYKGQIGTDKFTSAFSSQYGQTAIGRERASDLTVTINGVEIDTVYLPDNPRDMRGTLTLNAPYNGATSAGDFGYLVNLNVSKEKIDAIKAAVGADKTIKVTYSVKSDAANQNGFRIYSSTYGRYAVNPTLILNPAELESITSVTENKDIATATDNYSIQGTLNEGASYILRTNEDGGYVVSLSDGGETVMLVNKKTNEVLGTAGNLGAGAHDVKVTLFDEHITVFTDNNSEAVIDLYDYSGFTGGVCVMASASATIDNLVVSPESYHVPGVDEEDGVLDVHVTDDFSDPDYTNRYQVMGNKWSGNVADGTLSMSADQGDKIIMKDVSMKDGIYEADITVTNSNGIHGNVGFVFRGTNFNVGPDGADGYYAGIGDGYVQLGRMNQGWKELAKVTVPGLTVGSTHTLRVAVFGSRIQIYIDDATVPCVDLTDSTYLEGGVAIRGYRVAAKIKNIKISSESRYQTQFKKGIDEWEANGSWKVQDGEYTSSSNNAYSLIDSSKVKDLSYEADVTLAKDTSSAAMLVRAAAGKKGLSGYQIVADAKNDKISIVKLDNGTSNVLSEAGWQLKSGVTYHLTVEMKGASIKLYLGDREKALVMAEDSSFEAGQIGVMNLTGGVSVGNILVTNQFMDGELMAPVSTTALDKAVADAKKVDAQKYTPESYEVVKKALAAVEGINRFDQTEVDAATKGLTEAVKQLKEKPVNTTALDKAIAAAKKLDASKYTPESYAPVKTALAKAQAVNKKDQKAVDAAAKALNAAIAKLVLKPVPPKKNTVLTSGKLVYKVTKSAAKNGTVSVVKPAKKTYTSITIPKTVKLKGFTFKVTEIGKNAFKSNKSLKTVKIGDYVTKIGTTAFSNCKKLKTVTIGKGLKSIGSKAFYGDKSLKKVVIKSTGVTKVYSNAFKGMDKKGLIDVPNKKVKQYKKIFKKGGQPKTVKMK